MIVIADGNFLGESRSQEIVECRSDGGMVYPLLEH
jgi:hypothetical protein